MHKMRLSIATIICAKLKSTNQNFSLNFFIGWFKFRTIIFRINDNSVTRQFGGLEFR